MATFPSIKPNARSFSPGEHPNTTFTSVGGDVTSIRHSNGTFGSFLRLTFAAVTPTEHISILGHYNLHERFIPFDLSTDVLEGSGITVPTGYQWVYANSPLSSVEPDRTSITVELELLAPYSV